MRRRTTRLEMGSMRRKRRPEVVGGPWFVLSFCCWPTVRLPVTLETELLPSLYETRAVGLIEHLLPPDVKVAGALFRSAVPFCWCRGISRFLFLAQAHSPRVHRQTRHPCRGAAHLLRGCMSRRGVWRKGMCEPRGELLIRLCVCVRVSVYMLVFLCVLKHTQSHIHVL